MVVSDRIVLVLQLNLKWPRSNEQMCGNTYLLYTKQQTHCPISVLFLPESNKKELKVSGIIHRAH